MNALATDGRGELASGSDDHTIKRWSVFDAECFDTLIAHTQPVSHVRFQSSKVLISASKDQTIRTWRLTHQPSHALEQVTAVKTPITSFKNGFALISPKLDFTNIAAITSLLAVRALNLIQIWDVDAGECVRTLNGHTKEVVSVQLLTGHKLASGSLDTSIKTWKMETGECIRTLTGHSESVQALQLLSNNQLSSGSWDRSIKIWNVDSGECMRTMHGHSGRVYSLQPLANNRLASGADDNSIRIWHVDSGECLRAIENAHSSVIFTLQALGNNQLASGSGDYTIKIWNLELVIHTLLCHCKS